MPHTGFTRGPHLDWPGTGVSIPLSSETHCIEHVALWRVGTVDAETSRSGPQAWLRQAGDLPRGCIPALFYFEMGRWDLTELPSVALTAPREEAR